MTTKMADSELEDMITEVRHGRMSNTKAYEIIKSWHQKELARIADYVIGEDVPNLGGAAVYTYGNNIRAEQRRRLSALSKDKGTD